MAQGAVVPGGFCLFYDKNPLVKTSIHKPLGLTVCVCVCIVVCVSICVGVCVCGAGQPPSCSKNVMQHESGLKTTCPTRTHPHPQPSSSPPHRPPPTAHPPAVTSPLPKYDTNTSAFILKSLKLNHSVIFRQ